MLSSHRKPPAAILFDRDGTLVEDVPYNGNPALVVPRNQARQALEYVRERGVPTAVVTNQSGIGRGLITLLQMEAVNRRIEELLGPLGPWLFCPHHPDEGCECRKPAAEMLLQAAQQVGVAARDCAYIGDTANDMAAARAAGARAVLVPSPATTAEALDTADLVAADLLAAVHRLLDTE
jgi:histidinol-phosphate phosphatase family protein